MRKILPDCHPSFSLENVKGSSNYKIIKSGRSLDLAYQLGAMTIEGLTPPFLLVSSARQFLTPPAPSYIRGGEKGEYSYIGEGVMGIIAMTMVGLFSFNAQAECTPAPDCASIGYTETSCETKSVKCPFDTSKLFCLPCDSSFQYSCTGDNIVGGTGSSCGGKYVSCECESGRPFNNGVCPQNCTVGMIYYSDKSCSTELDSNKTAIGVVVKDNELVMNLPSPKIMTWGTPGTDVDTLTNTIGTGRAQIDYNGKEKTALIVEFQTTEGLTASNSAAIYCYEYSTEGTNAGDWYLPSAGDLYNVSIYYSTIKATMTKLNVVVGNMWSSSEKADYYAWVVSIVSGAMFEYYKGDKYQVSCFLAIN